MRIQIRTGFIALLLAIPVLATAQDRISAISAPGNAAEGGFECPNGGAALLNQQPNQSNGIFADTDCDFCAATGSQSMADDFTFLDDATITQLVVWGGYFPGDQVPGTPDDLTVRIFENAGGLPGALVDSQVVTPTATPTGVVLFGVSEVQYVVDLAPVNLTAGSYWIETYVNSAGNTDSYFWEAADPDPVSSGPGLLFATATPGVNWLPASGASDLATVLCGDALADPLDVARFFVNKDFDDNNEASVEVTLSCNTGIPLEQTTTIEEGDPVNFVIGDFNQGELNCTITETPVDGYSASYSTELVVGAEGEEATSCDYAELIGAQYFCFIENDLDQVSVEVTKEWVDENPGFNPFNVADAQWSCNNVAFECDDRGSFGCDFGSLNFYTEGSSDTDSFSVYPDWDTGTTCSITEVNLPDGGVEVDDNSCQNITLFPGGGASCTIVNTRLYEGIPTLSQYGLAVLALLMLGMGFVGFRRFV